MAHNLFYPIGEKLGASSSEEDLGHVLFYPVGNNFSELIESEESSSSGPASSGKPVTEPAVP